MTALLLLAVVMLLYVAVVVVLVSYELVDHGFVRWWFAVVAAFWPLVAVVLAVMLLLEPDWSYRVG